MESNHIQTENGQMMRKGQIDFKDGWRANTYTLRIGRQRKMLRLTSWGMKTNHVQTEDGQTMKNGQINFIERWGAITYRLGMSRRRERVRSTSWRDGD